MGYSLAANLTEASNLLLGIDRKLTKIQTEPSPLPKTNPVPPAYIGLGAVTRVRKTVQFRDGGAGYANERLHSEFYHIQAPVCDLRDTPGIMGDPSRLIGRGPTPVKK